MIERYLKENVFNSIKYLRREGIILKKLIGTTSPLSDTIYNKNSKILRIVEDDTLKRYISIFTRFLYFLTRINIYHYGYIKENGVDLTMNQYEIIRSLNINDDNESSISPYKVNDDIISILEERYLVTNGKFSIISIFIMCSCVTDRSTLLSNESLSSYCSALKYILRLMCLYKIRREIESNFERNNNNNEISIDLIDDEGSLFLINKTGIKEVDDIIKLVKNGLSYPFSQLLTISNYSRKFKSYERIPTVSWERHPDNDGRNGIMRINGFNFYIDDIISKRRDIIDKIFDIYKNDLNINIDDLSSLNEYHDDHIWHRNGLIKESIRFYKNDPSYEKYIKDYIYLKFKKREEYFDKDIGWNHSLLSKIKDVIDDLVKNIFVLIHISSGGVSRSPEYENIFIRSFNNEKRNVFIDNKNVVFVSYLSKTTKISGKSKIIPRFFDENVSNILLIYISMVKPFDIFLYNILNDNNQNNQNNNEDIYIRCSLFNIRHRRIRKEEYRSIFSNIFTIRGRSVSFKEYRHINHMISSFLSFTFYPSSLLREIENRGIEYFKKRTSSSLRFFLSSDIIENFIKQSDHSIETSGICYGSGYHPYLNQYGYINYKSASLLYHDFINGFNKEYYKSNDDININTYIYNDNDNDYDYDNDYNNKFSNYSSIIDRDRYIKFNNNIMIVKKKINDMNISLFKSKYQKEAIIQSLSGMDIIVRIGTSGGKTLIYEMRHLLDKRDGITFLFLPYRSLIDEKMKNLKIEKKYEWNDESRINIDRLILSNDKIFIISTYQSLLNNSYGIVDVIKENNDRNLIPLIVFDEFDHVFGYNSENIDNYNIISLISFIYRMNINMMFLSSTFRKKEIDFIKKKVLRSREGIKVICTDFDKKNISYNVRITSNDKIMNDLISLIKKYIKKDMKIIIFCLSIDKTIEVKNILSNTNIKSSHHYSSMSNSSKDENLKKFINGERKIMVTTTSLGIGIDINDIRVVIHLNGFYSIKNMIQETGRCGRDGKYCISYVIVSKSDFLKDKDVHNYVYNRKCRRNFLKKYMDGIEEYKCNGYEEKCDNCLDPNDFDEKKRRENDINETIEFIKGIDTIINDCDDDYDDYNNNNNDFKEENFNYESITSENGSYKESKSINFLMRERNEEKMIIKIEEKDYEDILDYIIACLKRNNTCQYCFNDLSLYKDHIMKKGYCSKFQSDKCIKCFRNGHNKTSCNLYIQAMRRYCFFCLIPSKVFYSKMVGGREFHSNIYGCCNDNEKDIIKSYVSNMLDFLKRNVEFKDVFKKQFFDFDKDDDYFNKSYTFINNDVNITYALLIYYWGKKNNINPYI